MKVLSAEVSLIVPTVRERHVQDELAAITKKIGGVTRTEVRGDWYDDSGVMHTDHSTQYTWYCPNPVAYVPLRSVLSVFAPAIIALLRLGEDTVGYIRDGRMMIVGREDFPDEFM